MSRRKTPTSSGDGTKRDGNKSYEIGYGKPPKHCQFRPGQSGNPAGRLKGARNLKTDVMHMLASPVKVREGDRTRTRSTLEGTLMVVREKALRGDNRAINCLFNLAARFNNDEAEIGPSQALPADDQAILDAHAAEIIAAAKTPATGESSDDRTSKRRGRAPRKKAPK